MQEFKNKPIFYLVIVIFILSLLSCGISKDLQQQRKSYGYNTWDQQFKERALCKCILEGMGTDLKNAIIKEDKSFFNPLAIALFDPTIDILLIREVDQMSKDSAASIGTGHPDLRKLSEGKRVMPHCVAFYESNRLDSAMKMEKVKWKKIGDIMDEITKTIPTY